MQKFYTRWENTSADDHEDRIMSIISEETHLAIAQLRKPSRYVVRDTYAENRWHFRALTQDDATIAKFLGENWKYETFGGFSRVRDFTDLIRRKECS